MLRLLLLLPLVSALELTPDNWEVTKGRTVFLKFFAPWCGHCKKMKPDWDRLMEKYADSETLVADVDCINEGKPLCDKVGVQGFPTIKYGDPNNLQPYPGGRDFESLDVFTQELTPTCNVDTFEHCTDEEKVLVDELRQRTDAELQDLLASEKDEREAVENTYKEDVKALQDEYQSLTNQKEKDLNKIKSKYNIGIITSLIGKSEL